MSICPKKIYPMLQPGQLPQRTSHLTVGGLVREILALKCPEKFRVRIFFVNKAQMVDNVNLIFLHHMNPKARQLVFHKARVG